MLTSTISAIALAVLFATLANAQAPGQGISKTTYACENPLPGLDFMLKYFPTTRPGDECSGDVCDCGDWNITQGRVYASYTKPVEPCPTGSPGMGFGMHLVNVAKSKTTGGQSVAQVEAHFATKLNGMKAFDSFMDFNAMFYTTGLKAYYEAFKADGVATYVSTWSYNKTTWTSVFVQVPNSMMVLELCQDTTLGVSSDYHPGGRASSASIERVLSKVHGLSDTTDDTTGAVIDILAVNHGASATSFAKLEDFYVKGMGCTVETTTTKDYNRKCFRWGGATVDICFYQRDDSATSGSFKVLTLEDMLHTVHTNIIGKQPQCNRDKWTDWHYAIDSRSADTSSIASYIDANKVSVMCGGTTPHYVIDPTGWGIQMDLNWGSNAVSQCSSSATELFGRKLLGPGNPSCQDATCA